MPRNRLTPKRARVICAITALIATLLAGAPTGASAVANTTVNPSGAAIPSFPGWRMQFSDNFTGGAVNTTSWSLYHNAHGKYGPVLPSNVMVHNGMISLRVVKRNGVWSSAGMCACRRTTGTYGTYLIRARYDHGLGTNAYALLWPVKGWPPEVDFMEFDDRDATHHRLGLTNHYSSANRMQHAFVSGDYTRWHTFGLQWTPTSLRYTLDGRTTAVMTGHVPQVPMWLGIANNIGTSVKPGPTTPNPVSLDIDWVAYYKRA